MEKIKRYGIILLVLMAICGVGLGVSVTLFALSFFDARRGFVLAGFVCAIISTALTLVLPFLIHARDNQIAKVDTMLREFGQEVSFLNEKEFLKTIERKRAVPKIYALHVELAASVNELKRKEVGFALSKAIEGNPMDDTLIGYDSEGNFVFYTTNRERELIKTLKKVEAELLKNASLPTLSLLLGASRSEGDYPRMIEEAIAASSFSAENRSDLDLFVYDEEKQEEKSIDIAKEIEHGRLSFYVQPFVKEGEDGVELLAPTLYDAFRGDISGKDLSQAMMLLKALPQLDDASIKRAINRLRETDDSHSVIVRISKESAQNPSFLGEIAEKMEKAMIKKERLIIGYLSLDLGEKSVRLSVNKAKALGFRVCVYDYGGENVDRLIGASFSFALIKPELLRKTSDPEVLHSMVKVLSAIGIPALIEKGKLCEELSMLPALDLLRLDDEEIKDSEEEEK